MAAKNIINGTWGEVWVDNNKIGECYGLQAKISFNKEEIKLCGQMGTDTKVTGYKGTGSLKMHKVSSRFAKMLIQLAMDGKDVRCTIISKLADPDSAGAERVALKECSFDDLTLADWEAGTVGKQECPFTFTKAEYLDMI